MLQWQRPFCFYNLVELHAIKGTFTDCLITCFNGGLQSGFTLFLQTRVVDCYRWRVRLWRTPILFREPLILIIILVALSLGL